MLTENMNFYLEHFPLTISIEGAGYEGRNERLEYVKVGDPLILKTDWNSKYYSPVAVEVFNKKNETLGYLRNVWDISLDVIAQLVDEGRIKATVESITPLSKRRKGSKYALMDVRMELVEPKQDKKKSEKKVVKDKKTNEEYTSKTTRIQFINSYLDNVLDRNGCSGNQFKLTYNGMFYRIDLYDEEYQEPFDTIQDNNKALIELLFSKDKELSNKQKDEIQSEKEKILDSFTLLEWNASIKSTEQINNNFSKKDDGLFENNKYFGFFKGTSTYDSGDGNYVESYYGEIRYRLGLFTSVPSQWSVLEKYDFSKLGLDIDIPQLMSNSSGSYTTDRLELTQNEFDVFINELIKNISEKDIVLVADKICIAPDWYENFGYRSYAYFGDKLLTSLSGYDFDNPFADNAINEQNAIDDLKSFVKNEVDLNSLSDLDKQNLLKVGVDFEQIGKEVSQQQEDLLSSLSDTLDSIKDLLNSLGVNTDEQSEDEEKTRYITNFEYKEGNQLGIQGCQVDIPDHFVMVKGKKAKDKFNREFMAYLANENGDEEEAYIKIYPGMSFPLSTMKMSDVGYYMPEVAETLYRFEMAANLPNLVNSGAYTDAYMLRTKTCDCWCMYLDNVSNNYFGGAYFFYPLIPINNNITMFRIDIRGDVVENEETAKKLVADVVSHFNNEIKIKSYERLDSDAYTSNALDKKIANKWIKTFKALTDDAVIINNVRTQSITKEIIVDGLFGKLNQNNEEINKAAKVKGNDLLEYVAKVIEAINSQVINFFAHSTKINDKNSEISRIIKVVEDHLKETTVLRFSIDDVEISKRTVANAAELKSVITNFSTDLSKETKTKEDKKGNTEKKELSAVQEKKLTQVEKRLLKIKEFDDKKEKEGREFSKKYPASNTSADNSVSSWIRRTKSDIDSQNSTFKQNINSINSLMQRGLFSSMYDPTLQPYFNKMREQVSDIGYKYERTLDSINNYFNKEIKEGCSIKSLKNILKLYESVCDDGESFTIAINSIDIAKYSLPYSYKAKISTMKTAINDLKNPKEKFDSEEEKEREKIVKQLEECNKQIEELNGNLNRFDDDLKEANEQVVELQKSLSVKEQSYDADKQKIVDEVEHLIQYHQKDIIHFEDNVNNLEKEKKDVTTQLEKTFAFNFGKKKELKNKVEQIDASISNEKAKIDSSKKDIEKLNQNQINRVKQLEENILIIKESIAKAEKNVGKIEKSKPEMETKLSELIPEKERLEYLIEHFHEEYVAKQLKMSNLIDKKQKGK